MSTVYPRIPGRAAAAGHARICAVIVALFVAAAGLSALRKDVTVGFDELAHVSYVAAVQSRGALSPDLRTMPMLDAARFTVTASRNYLNHPPFYYDLMALLTPTLEGHPAAVLVARLWNVALATAGLAALLAVGLVAHLSRDRFYAYAVPLACVPVLVPLAGAVNNDNLAFAGGALAMLAAWQLADGGGTRWLYAALAGAVAASWAKLTGLMLSGGLVAGVLAWLAWRGRFERRWGMPLLLATVAAVTPYAAFMLEYGSPAPATAGQVAMLAEGARLAGWDHLPRMSLPHYAFFFTGSFLAQWTPTLLPRNLFHDAMLALPALAVACAAMGVAVSLRRVRRSAEGPLDVLVVAGAIAFAVTYAVHIGFSYERHLAFGWMMDAYPRYYLPVVAIVPLAGISLVTAIRGAPLRLALLGFMIAGPILYRIAGAPFG